MDVYQIVTDRMIEALEAGVVPWRRTWKNLNAGQWDGPQNAISKKPYRGVNVWLLDMAAKTAGYTDPRWLTFKQAQQLGGCVRKGERSTLVVFWKIGEPREVEDENGDVKARKSFMLRYYNVFNVEQCDGLTKLKALDDLGYDTRLNALDSIEAAQEIVDNMPNKPMIREGNNEAFYMPSGDWIAVPAIGQYKTAEEYYATLFHELSHSTLHESRLNRKQETGAGMVKFGCETYAREELVAEMGSAFLCSVAGIEATFDNSASYLANWLKKLRDDKRLVISAASQAQKAADYILDRGSSTVEAEGE